MSPSKTWSCSHSCTESSEAPGCEIKKLNLGSWNIPVLLSVLVRISVDCRVSSILVSCRFPVLPSCLWCLRRYEHSCKLSGGKAYTKSGVKILASTCHSCQPSSALPTSSRSTSLSFSKSWSDSLINTTGGSVKPIKYYELRKGRRAVDLFSSHLQDFRADWSFQHYAVLLLRY